MDAVLVPGEDYILDTSTWHGVGEGSVAKRFAGIAVKFLHTDEENRYKFRICRQDYAVIWSSREFWITEDELGNTAIQPINEPVTDEQIAQALSDLQETLKELQ